MGPAYSSPRFLANENLLPSLQASYFCEGCRVAPSVCCLNKRPKPGKEQSRGRQDWVWCWTLCLRTQAWGWKRPWSRSSPFLKVPPWKGWVTHKLLDDRPGDFLKQQGQHKPASERTDCGSTPAGLEGNWGRKWANYPSFQNHYYRDVQSERGGASSSCPSPHPQSASRQ